MSLLRTLPRPRQLAVCLQPRRFYAAKADDKAAAASAPTAETDELAPAKSSCPEGTILVGLNWRKGQAPVMALPDDAYPDWLWKLLEPKQLPDDGPGGKAEKYRMRRENRLRIREQNFMKTQ